MAIEPTPASTASDGNFRINTTATGSNALSVAILNGGTSYSLTYGFTPDGFNRNITENTVDDPRLTLKQVLSRPGTKTEVVEVKYVQSTTAGSADVILTEGYTGSLTLRYGIDNSVVWTVGQKVDVITFIAGAKRKDAPTANGLFTTSQTLYITSPTVEAAVLIA